MQQSAESKVGMARAPEAAALAGVSVRTWWQWYHDGRTPQGFKVTPKYRGWRRAELHAWVDAGCPPMREWAALVKARKVSW